MIIHHNHKQKAKHNKDFLDFICINDPQSIITPKYPDWMVTVSFYIALQYVDDKLDQKGIHPRNHSERNREVAINFPKISGDYFYIYGKSKYARYFPDSERNISLKAVSNIISMSLTKFI